MNRRQTFGLSNDSNATSYGQKPTQKYGGLIKQSESHIKQSKRWLSSKWTDWETFFAPYLQVLLSKIAEQKGALIFVIDGSETAADCVTLMLSVIWKGYAIPVVWITRVGKKGHFSEDVHLDLLAMVQKNSSSKVPGGVAWGWRV